MSPVTAPAALPSATLQTAVAVVRKAKPAPYGWTTYTVRSGDNLAAIAARTGTTTGALAARNHLSHGGNVLSVGQRLSVPKTAAQARAEAARARAASAARAAAIRRATYVVRSGDSLSSIAARKHVSLAALLKANKLTIRSVLQVGQKIRIPGAGAASARRPVAAAPSITTYRVRSGDTLSVIATRTRTALATVYALNRLTARSVIQPGQVLRVHGATPAATRPAGTAAYVVRAGDTLSGIASKHSVTLAALLKTNRLTARSAIYPGQRLKVPATPAKSATSANTFAGRTYSTAIVSAADRNRATLARRAVPSRTQTRAMIVATARRNGVDPKLALAVAWQESGWNQRQVSVANAIGVMQVIPSSGQWASDMAGRRLDLLNTQDNITAGIVILRSLTRAASTVDQAIAGYYQGLYSVQHQGMYADTKAYVASIKAHRATM
ncbi:LysM repeat protein [Phycicoccus badiiscoriae]|uniref:LysM repeat protein n=1 Tax=Pedococcus badiiscoriae TaxID=642776 RepID=A0A852W9K8_9MICO|nr:LysM peptidoglycan-binding domain-containing protein [Pedococcus badiiscoriae]NYG05559.1 LysM repeat protein [Pedococcus badiiscoriae]